MKELELVVYPHVMDGGWDCIEDSEGTLRTARELDDFAQAKRLTDAELAAEYHAQQMEAVRAFDRAYPYGESAELDAENARIEVVERFATLPHYDDPTETGSMR